MKSTIRAILLTAVALTTSAYSAPTITGSATRILYVDGYADGVDSGSIQVVHFANGPFNQTITNNDGSEIGLGSAAAGQNTEAFFSPSGFSITGGGGANASASTTGITSAVAKAHSILSLSFYVSENAPFYFSGALSGATNFAFGQAYMELYSLTDRSITYTIGGSANPRSGTFSGELPFGNYSFEARVSIDARAGPYSNHHGVASFDNLNLTVGTVPEPSAAALIIVTGIGFAMRRRRPASVLAGAWGC